MSDFKDNYGPWAIVTGASAGIGEEFATQLAAKGLNVVLTARRADKLRSLADRLEAAHGVQTRTVPLDLLSDGFAEQLVEQTADLDVGLVVNNAGAYKIGRFLDNSIDSELRILELNTRAPLLLAHALTPRLVERGRGGLIFVSSTMAYQGVPFAANYAATKAWDLHFAEGLAYELAPHNVDVLALSPGLTATEGISQVNTEGFALKPMPVQPVVAKAIKKLGRRWSTIPGRLNNTIAFFGKFFFPRRTNTKILGGMLGKTLPPEGAGLNTATSPSGR